MDRLCENKKVSETEIMHLREMKKGNFRFHSIHDHIDLERLQGICEEHQEDTTISMITKVNIARKNQLPGAEQSQKGSAANDHLISIKQISSDHEKETERPAANCHLSLARRPTPRDQGEEAWKVNCK